MSRIFLAMVREGVMSESETVVVYATVTALTRFGVPVKRILAQLISTTPRDQIPEVERMVLSIIDEMVEPEASPRGSSGGP